MEHFEKYKRRLERKGSNYVDAMISNSKKVAKEKFHTSPSFSIVALNDVEIESIVTNKSDSVDKEILFLPDQDVYQGDVIHYKDNDYLILGFFENDVYPKAEMRICNATFPIISDKTRVLIGYDEYQRPVYNYVTNTNQVPCIIESRYSFTRSNQQITLPDNRIEIMIKYVDSESLKLDSEFEMRDGIYKIKNIDYSKVVNDTGILIVSAERQVG